MLYVYRGKALKLTPLYVFFTSIPYKNLILCTEIIVGAYKTLVLCTFSHYFNVCETLSLKFLALTQDFRPIYFSPGILSYMH